ncbi:MAG: UvrD-helicase domain-containing protein [Candidatus Eisenbacteria bacterium]|uniref:DNA 3'-5' helicase n=1 Tax=Eiseniibacteriota bacterium TaxID=2212470 RepID=A0A956LWY2_UNCEI|nr:UvrD-helicase domain-containing protein [Candidatus Eisenbacteria bacterium]
MSARLVRDWTPAQKVAVHLEGRDILVTAGAGTGKTSVLVGRILRKLRDRSARDLDRLLVVTFTEKAAAEMKERIHEALAHDRELRRLLPQLPRAPISTIHAFCARLLREQFLLAGVEPGFRILDEQSSVEALEESLRKTFHGWYVRDDEAGAEFRRLVELAGFTEEGEALRSIVRRLYFYSRSTADPAGYLDGLSVRHPAETLDELPWAVDFGGELATDWRDGLALYEHALEIAERDGFDTQKHRRFLDVLGSFDPERFGDDQAQTSFQRLLQAEALLADGGQGPFQFPKAPTGAAKNPIFKTSHDKAKGILRGPLLGRLFDPAADLLAEDRHLIGSMRVLVDLVREMSTIYERYKERGGYLDYSDLEVRASRLLVDHGRDLAMADRFDEVLVDEYQDVNALQESILSAVSRPGHRFRVGDVKQSIYRFRLADPTIFLEQSREALPVSGGDRPVEGDQPVAIFMNENHRSRPEILRFVNRVFQDLFDAETIGSDYAAQELRPAREPASEAPAIELHWIDSSEPKAGAQEDLTADGGSGTAGEIEPLDLRELQPRLVARRLAALAADPILHDDGGTVEWSRVAILLRARTHASYYVDALAECGIPAQVGDGGALLDEPVVRDLVVLLRLIDNPRDDVVMAAALRSPIFGFGDADLLRVRLARPASRSYLDAAVGTAFLDLETSEEGGGDGETIPTARALPAESDLLACLVPPAPFGTGQTRNVAAGFEALSALRYWAGVPHAKARDLAPDSLRERLREALRRLVGWRRRVQEEPLGLFLQELLFETHLQALVSGAGGGAHPRACLEKLLELGRAYEAERGPSLRGFLARLDALEQSGGVDSVPHAATGGVRILTVHKSKGLEFPVVVVPQLDWRFHGKDRLASRIRIGPEYVGLRRFDPELYARVDSLARQTLEHEQERELREEEQRVLYVALTRARERLLLVAAGNPKQEEIDDPLVRRILAKRVGQSIPWIAQAVPWESAIERSSEEIDERPVRELGFPALSLAVTIVPKERLGGRESESDRASTDAAPGNRTSEGANGTRAFESRSSSSGSARTLGSLWTRISKLPPRPPIAAIDGLRAKYWVTEFGHTNDRMRFADLREEASTIWLPSLFDVVEDDGAESGRRRSSGNGSSDERDEAVVESGEAGQLSLVYDTPAGAGESAAERGVRYHMAMARLDLPRLAAARGRRALDVARQLEHLREEPWWGSGAIDPAIESGIGRFFESRLGADLCEADPASVEREVAFSLKWSVSELGRYRPELLAASAIDARWTRAQWDDVLDRSWVLLQGRIDCLFRKERHWALIDWKSDRVTRAQAPDRAEHYRSQIALYADAVRRLWGGPVRSYVVFLVPGATVELQ